jgi:peptidoglycan/LPS O-acetylase OafA/YrhL
VFKGIEGLRGWLAWTVVFAHTAEVFGLDTRLPKGELLREAGDDAVLIFIIISGFVITHLILEKQEPFFQFIGRRALRIYPAYLVALAFAIATSPLLYQGVFSFSAAPSSMVEFATREESQFRTNFAPHLLAHLALLQGAVPNSVLPDSQYMFLAPAWSLSLEWQFYLIAPFWIWLMLRKPPLAVGGALAAVIVSKLFLWKGFHSPSFLPGAALWFLVGIATRLILPSLPKFKAYPLAIMLGGFGLAIFDKNLIALSVWIAMVCYVLQPEMNAGLDSWLARHAGARSFGVYLIHAPILGVALFLCVRLGLSGTGLIVAVAGATVAATIIASEIVHRWVEVPAINFGKKAERKTALRAA